MEIFAILVVFCCLILIVCGFGFFRSSDLRQRHQTRSRRDRQALSDAKISGTQTAEAIDSKSKQSPSSKVQTQPHSNKHQRNIHYSTLVLEHLRRDPNKAKLPIVIATLRRLNPYVFEELLLTCCKKQGWQIQRNSRYSGDGGVDGRVLIAGSLYLIQAKRYINHIKSEHIRDFHEVIEKEGAAGGFFIHTGKTGRLSKQLLCEFKITLISGQRLVDFVMGQKLKIVGVTIPISSNADADHC